MSAFSLPGVQSRKRPSGAAPQRSGILIVASASLIAMLIGLVSITASPIVVAFAATLIVAPILILRPRWSLWALLVLGLLVAGLVPIWAAGGAAKVVWALSGLSFLLLVVVLFRAATTRGMTAHTPAFIWVALAFLVYALVNSVLQFSTLYELAGGFKRYFQAYGLLFCLAWLAFDERLVGQWRRLVVFVALVQLPWAIYERIHLVPLRTALAAAYPGLVPVDVVAGTFGANMTEGGANAEMATFLLFMLAFLLARLRERSIGLPRAAVLALPIVAPLFLGETKVVVLFLPLLFGTLYRRELLSRPLVALAGLSIGAALTVGAAATYMAINNKNLADEVADTVSYNFQERGHGGFVLNRTTTLKFWAKSQSLSDPVSAVFGNGLGTAHDSTAGHLSLRYFGYGIGLTAASLLLWEQGAVGLCLYLATIALAWPVAGRLRARAGEAWVRADAAAIQATIPLLLAYTVYRGAQLEGLPFQLIICGLLGYLAWMHRRQAAVIAQAR